MKRHNKSLLVAAVVVATAGGLTACSGGEGSASGESAGGNVQIEFFQSKSEAIDTFNDLIATFEAENPGITVSQTNTPDPNTAIQSRLAKGDVPDVVSLGSDVYQTLVSTGALTDLTDSAAASLVTNQAAKDGLAALGMSDKSYGLPMSVNAELVLYNKDLWDQMGLGDTPTTWTELMDVAQKIKDAGKNPFYFTNKDAWTTGQINNGIAASVLPADFITQVRAGSTAFDTSDEMRTTAEKLVELSQFAQSDASGRAYTDGNTAFANGESVMYTQGDWAISQIKAVNPDISLGAFVMPGTDDASANKVVSGPDSFLGILEGAKHPEEAEKFIEFLLSPEAQTAYSNGQDLFSVLTDVSPDSDITKAVFDDFVSQERTALPLDAFFTGSSDYHAINQTLFTDGDVDAYLKALQANWEANGVKE